MIKTQIQIKFLLRNCFIKFTSNDKRNKKNLKKKNLIFNYWLLYHNCYY